MERTNNSEHFRNRTLKRFLSILLTFTLLLGLLPVTFLANLAAAAQTVTIYFKNSDGWDNVYGYVWDEKDATPLGGWPGTKLSKDGSTGLYKLSVQHTPTTTGEFNFIFNCGSSDAQTADLSLSYAQLTAGKTYWVGGSGGTPVAMGPTINNGKVTFTYQGSASKVLLAGSMNGWAGVAMTKSGSTFTYTYDLEPGTYEYKFVVDGGWINDPSNPLTTGSDNNNYFIIPGAAVGNTVTIHFSDVFRWTNICASAWMEGDAELQGWEWPGQPLQKDADGYYTLELKPELKPGQKLGYLFNDYSSAQTADLFIDYNTLSKGNVELWLCPGYRNGEGKYDCLVVSDPSLLPKIDGNKVTFTYAGNADSVYVAGDFNSWNSSATKMTKKNGVFTCTTDIANGSYGYKFVVDGKWIRDPYNLDTIGEGDDRNSLLTVRNFTSPKVEGTEVTFTYAGNADSVYVAGDFNSWNSSAAKMTKSGTTFTCTIPLSKGIYQYKFVVKNSGKKDDWCTDPANGSYSYSGNSVVFVGDHKANPNPDKINVLFHISKSGSFTGWDSWVWAESMEGTAYALQTGTVRSKLVNVTVDSINDSLGFILRKSDWSEQSPNFYVDLNKIVSGTIHCFVDYDSKSMVQINDTDVKYSVFRAEMDYQDNYFWIKPNLPMDLTKVSVVDPKGNPSGINVTSVTQDGFGYKVTIDKTVTLEDLPNLRLMQGREYSKIEPNGYIFYSSRFNNEYTYHGTDLGATWSAKSTFFKVWAPTAWNVQLVRYSAGDGDAYIETLDMVRGEKGVWSLTVPGNLHGTYYNYRAQFAYHSDEAVDPYAKSTGVDGYRSMVLNMDATDPEGWENDVSPNSGMNYTDAIIYEMHVREFTLDKSSGVKDQWKGKFLGLTQEGTNYNGRATGLDHLKELGVTHVQLMPVYDFGNFNPDETHMGAEGTYGWGYNPQNLNTPEGSYSTNPFDGAVRVNEMKTMVQTFHSNGINVIMDVVYNHVQNAGGFCYNKLVPYYFTRFRDKNGDWGGICNVSGVGNDLATQRAMARDYIVDSLSYWVEEYHIDGFRFDLAGLIDLQTINEAIRIIHAKCGKSIIFYGEGWVLDGSNMEGAKPCNQYFAGEAPGFGFFNPVIRDAVVGNENEHSTDPGFTTDVKYDTDKAWDILNSARAINYNWNDAWDGPMTNPNQLVNYAACHDKYTLTDKIRFKTNGKTSISDYDQYVAKTNRLTNAVILLSQGIPLIYGGDELLRQKTKLDGSPSHNSGHEKDSEGRDYTRDQLDALNTIVWSDLVNKYHTQTTDDYYAGLIEFRKNHAALRCTDPSLIASSVVPYKINNHCIMLYMGKINGECSDGIVIIFNASMSDSTVNFYDHGIPAGNWQACIHGDKAGTKALWPASSGSVVVEANSATVLVLGDLVDENSIYNTQPKTVCRHNSHNTSGKCLSCGTTVSHDYYDGTCKICGKTLSVQSDLIYVDVSGFGWKNVNVYTWDDDQKTYTGQWPGTAMTKVDKDVYSFKVPSGAKNIIFNDGSNQTADLVIPTDGSNYYSYLRNSWFKVDAPCNHSYTSEVTKQATCTTAGEEVYTCTSCGDTYMETIPALGHSFVEGYCTVCGTPDGTVSEIYYLVGFINGSDYGFNGDEQNMGQYKFVDGKLTAKFDADSYVFLKTHGNRKWLWADTFCQDTTCTFYEGKSEKMFVPGGVELTFTLTENTDGSVTLSYTKEGTLTPSTQPTIALKYPTLTFEDVILMNVYFSATDLEDVVEMGLVTYTSSVTSADVNTADAVVPGYTYSEADGLYCATTNGIAAKDLGDELYFAVYAKLADGTYYYTKVVSYSPSKYAYSSLSTGAASMKPIVVAMLNYGAAAQTYFGYKTDSLVNANLTTEQKALVESYRSDMIATVAAASTTKQGALVSNGGFSRRYPTVSFEGAFCINYYCTPSSTVKGDLTLYYWDQAAFDANSVLTTKNATAAIPMTLDSTTGEYHAAVEGIAAKDLDKGVYVAFVYSDGTTTYSSGILAYSIGTYCSVQAGGTGATAELAKATAVYGYYANQLFNQ